MTIPETQSLRDRLSASNLIFRDVTKFTVSRAELFQDEFELIEYQQSSSNQLSQLYHQSELSLFLIRISIWGWRLPALQLYFPKLLVKAPDKSPATLSGIASEYESLAIEFFHKSRPPVADWPQFVEIQQGLEIYGKTGYHRLCRKVKMNAQRQLKYIFDQISGYFPGWKWAEQLQCYFTASLSDVYKLPSGKFSC